MRILSRLASLLPRPSASADEPAASTSASDAQPPPVAHGDDKVEEPAREPGLKNNRKRSRRGGDIVVVDDHDQSPTASTSMSLFSSTAGLSPLQDMRRPADTSDERRLFPSYSRSNDGVRITPGQTFGTAKSRVQKHALRPIDRISRGFKDSGPVRASGAPRIRPGQVSQYPLSSPTLRDNEDRVVKRRRHSSNQVIDLVDDDLPTAPFIVRDRNSRPVRSPSIVSVESIGTRNETGRNNEGVRVRGREPEKSSVARLKRNSGRKQNGLRSPNSAAGEKRLGSPLFDERETKSNRSYRDKSIINSTVEDGEPADTTDLTREEPRSASRRSRRDSNGSESPDELQRDFTRTRATVSRLIHGRHIGIDVPSNNPQDEVRRSGRKDSPSDIQPTTFRLSRKAQKKQQIGHEPGRSHLHLFDVRFFRHGDVELGDQDLQLSLDEETDTIGLLSTNDSVAERIPVYRVASMVQGSDGSLKARFRLCYTEGSPVQSVDIEFGNDQDKTRLCEILEKRGVTSQRKEGSWMDKAFDKAATTSQSRQAPIRVKEPTTGAVVELAPEPRKEAQEEPVKRKKLSASLQDENNSQSGLKLPPRRLPLQIQSQISPSWIGDRSRPAEENQAVDIPVKTSNRTLGRRESRSKARQSLVDLIDDDPDSAIDGVPSSPTNLSKTLVYPPEGRKKAEVDSSDIERLRDGEFLNDNLIGFYLRFLEHHLERNKPDVAKRVYFFNSYFFDTLTSPAKGKRGINYEGVQKWTRNVDLFSHDYVIVPINESAHWYLAIICNLTSLDKSKDDDTQLEREPEPEPEPGTPSQSVPIQTKQVEEIPETPPERAATPEKRARESFASMKISDSLSSSQHWEGYNSEEDRLEKEENQVSRPAELRNDESTSITQPKKKDGDKGNKSKRKGPILSADQPTIVTFDSLGAARSPAIRILRTYLLEEAVSKRSLNVDAKDIKGMTAKEIPLQPNFSDCGLYLLAYLEKFVQDPDTFVRNLLRKQMRAEDDWPALISGRLRRRLRSFLFKLQEEQDSPGEHRLVDANPISYLLGCSKAEVASSAGPEVVPETLQETTEDVQHENSAAELSETEVIQETQLSELQKADATSEAQEDSKKADPEIPAETAQPTMANQADEDVVEVIEQPQTPKSQTVTRLEKPTPKSHSSPKSARKAKTEEHPLPKATPPPENNKDEPANPDNVWDEMLDFISNDAPPPPKVKVEVQVPKIQVPGTPPSAKKAGKAVQSPRKSKSKKRGT